MRLDIVEEIGSTSEALKQRVGEPGEAALLARRQTAGRGRLGRRWLSEAGNLHLSVLLRPAELRWPGHWSSLAAVALLDAVRPFAPERGRLRLKWPNDLLLDGGKLAGILVEAGLAPAPWLVIGFGVNLVRAPDRLDQRAACLALSAKPPERVAADLLRTLQEWRGRYAAEGYGPVRAAWLASGHRPGDWLQAGVGGSRVAGSFVGLGDDGSLLLDGPDGPCVVVAGEVT